MMKSNDEILAPTAQPAAAPFLFIAMDDDKRASVTWCADEAAVREAAKRSMFWLQPGEQLSAEHANELDGCVAELLDSGAMHFEGDPPLYLFRVGNVAQPVQQPGAEPDGRLHTDGYFTWKRRDGYVLDTKLPCDFYLAAPAQRQPLTQDEILDMAEGVSLQFHDLLEFARAIEAAHGIAAQKGEKL